MWLSSLLSILDGSNHGTLLDILGGGKNEHYSHRLNRAASRYPRRLRLQMATTQGGSRKMQCSDLEIILIGILMISIRLQAYTASMVITVLIACLMGIHQMYKFLKNEKNSCDGSRN